jgi:hypothetical protein
MGAKHILRPESVRDYLLGDSTVEISFVTDGSGRATQLITHEGGAYMYLARLK